MAKQAVDEYLAGLENCSSDVKAQRVTGLCYDLMIDTAKFFEAVAARRDFGTIERYFLPLSEALSSLHQFNREVIGAYLPHDRTGARLALRAFGCSVASFGLEMKYHESSGIGLRFPPEPVQEVGAALQTLGIGIVNIANGGYSLSEKVVAIAEVKNNSLGFLDGVVNRLAAEAIFAPVLGGLQVK